jgi:DNA-binding transcriptional MerR regulator
MSEHITLKTIIEAGLDSHILIAEFEALLEKWSNKLEADARAERDAEILAKIEEMRREWHADIYTSIAKKILDNIESWLTPAPSEEKV